MPISWTFKKTSPGLPWCSSDLDCASTADGTGLIPGQGTNIPHAIWHSQKNKNPKRLALTTSVILTVTTVTKRHSHSIFLTHCSPTLRNTIRDNVNKGEITSCHKHHFPYTEALLPRATCGTNDYTIQDFTRKREWSEQRVQARIKDTTRVGEAAWLKQKHHVSTHKEKM